MTRDITDSQLTTVVWYTLVALLAVGLAGGALVGGAAAQSGGDFQVTIDSTNSPVSEGETLDVKATIENQGSSQATQVVNLTVGGSVRDSETVTLDPNNQTTVTFNWQTGSGDSGSYNAVVTSENDTASTGVRVKEPANFQVRINSTNAPVTEKDTLRVEVVIENTGDEIDNQEIDLAVDGDVEDNTTVGLDAGARQTRVLTWDTEDGDAGDHDINVSSENDFDTDTVTVRDVSNFTVQIDSTNEPVVEGDTLEVQATIENTDTAADTQDIELAVDGTVRDTETIQLDGNEDRTVTLTWDTDRGDAGDYEVNVSSETDRESIDIGVNAPPTAAFIRDPVAPNVDESVTFEADASDPDGTVDRYEWTIDGEVVSGSESFTYTFTEPGDHEVTLTVTDDEGASRSKSRTISVNAPPEVAIADVEATVGEEAAIEADVSDDGSIASYEWSVDGQVVSTQETLTYTFESAGTHQVTLRVTDDNGATSATTKAITVASDATPTPTDTATPTASATASPPDEDQPGFGIGLALVAMLLGTTLLARRR